MKQILLYNKFKKKSQSRLHFFFLIKRPNAHWLCQRLVIGLKSKTVVVFVLFYGLPLIKSLAEGHKPVQTAINSLAIL